MRLRESVLNSERERAVPGGHRTAHFRNCRFATDFSLGSSWGRYIATAFMPIPCQLVGHVHEDRGNGRDPGSVASRGDVAGGTERDRNYLCGSVESPRAVLCCSF